MARCAKLFLLLIPLMSLLFSLSAGAMHLQDLYDQAGPGERYDKLIILDPKEIYTGYLVVDSGTSCAIRGNGALIVLDPTGSISAHTQAKLDIERCVITAGAFGLDYDHAPNSRVESCTIVGNTVGIRCWLTNVTITNCIVAGNSQIGIACYQGSYPHISYNNVWGNAQGNYMAYCSEG